MSTRHLVGVEQLDLLAAFAPPAPGVARDAAAVSAVLELDGDPVDVDLFAGPGGWDEGVRPLGVRPLGIEWKADACATAEAAGHRRLQADIAALDPDAVLAEHFGPDRQLRGLIASPPCQGFSMAGKGRGRADSAELLATLTGEGYRPTIRTQADVEAAIAGLQERMTDPRSVLVLEPLRWALALTPEWTAWEQVPAVLPIWEACAAVLRSIGYTVATGVLSAEQHGVPQTRQRAILVARSPRLTALLGPAQLPTPTHSRYYPRTPEKLDAGVTKWVSMAEALGWPPGDRIGFPRRADTDDAVVLDGVSYRARDLHPATRPAPALTEKVRSWSRFPAEPGRPDVDGLGFAGAGATSQASVGQIPRDPDNAPAHTVTGVGSAYWIRMGNHAGATSRPVAAPAPTVMFGNRANAVDWFDQQPPTREQLEGAGLGWAPEAPTDVLPDAPRKVRRVTVAEAAVLQSFPADYPWQGNKTGCYRQVGDAVPPLLAQVVVAAVSGLALGADEDADAA